MQQIGKEKKNRAKGEINTSEIYSKEEKLESIKYFMKIALLFLLGIVHAFCVCRNNTSVDGKQALNIGHLVTKRDSKR